MNKLNIYKQTDDCLLEDMDGEILLYNPTSATTLHLNGSSAVVWGLCDGKSTTQAIIDAIKEAYPEQSTQIEKDIIDVIANMSEKKVLELVE